MHVCVCACFFLEINRESEATEMFCFSSPVALVWLQSTTSWVVLYTPTSEAAAARAMALNPDDRPGTHLFFPAFVFSSVQVHGHISL